MAVTRVPLTNRRRQLRLENLEDRTVPAVITWGGATSGSFSDPTKWIGGVAPGPTDDAVIPTTSAVVTVSGATSVNSLVLAGDLSVTSGAFTVNNGGSFSNDIIVASGAQFVVAGGSMAWTGGTISGAGTFQVSAPADLALSGSASKTIDTATIANSGTITVGGSSDLSTGNNAVINNAGTFALTTDVDVNANFGARPNFNNTGLVTKSSGFGLASGFSTFFNNLGGTITVNSGQLNLYGGNSTGGTYNVGAASILDLTSGQTVNYTGTYTGSGAGTVRLATGTISVTLTNAAFNFPAGLFQQTGGTISGLAGSTLTNNGHITIASPSSAVFGTTNLVNNGTINIAGAASWSIGSTAITNAGTIELQTAAGILSGFGTLPTITNSGTIRKVSGAESVIDVPVNNQATGIVRSLSSVLDISRGGINAGTFEAIAPASIEISEGLQVNAGGQFTGTGELLLSASELNLTSPANASNVRWSAGGIVGSPLTVTGSLNVTGGSTKYISAGRVINAGTGTMDGTGEMQFGNAAVFENTGTFTFQSDSDFRFAFGTTGNQFINSGTVVKTSALATGLTLINDIAFNNSGALSVQSGIFGTDVGTHSGTFHVEPAAQLTMYQGVHTFNPGSSFTGTGLVSLELSADLIANTPLQINRLRIVDADIGGPSMVTVTGNLTWTGGGVSGALGLAPGAVGAMQGGAVKYLSGGLFTNNGTMSVSGTGELQMGNGSQVQNNGSWTFLSDVSVRYAFGTSGNVFNNAGTLIKTSSLATGLSLMNDITFNNAGTVNVSSGILGLDVGTHSGAFNVAGLATLTFFQGLHTFNTGASFGGDGLVSLQLSADLVVNTPLTINRLGLVDADIDGPATLTVTDTMSWTGGGVSGNVAIADGAAASISGGTTKYISGGTVVNDGTTTMSGTGELQFGNAATLRNNNTFSFASDAGPRYAFGTAGNLFRNLGTVAKTGGTGTTLLNGLTLDNTGTASAQSGTFQFSAIAQLAAGTLSAGNWIVGNSSSLVFPSAVTTLGASAAVTLQGAASNLPQITGLTTNNGTFRLAGGRDFTTTAALTNAGRIVIGPESLLTIGGAFTQTVAGTTVSQIADQPASGKFGVLSTAAAATLNGTIEVELTDGFGPTAGGNFRIMNFASQSGSFNFVSPSTPRQGDLFAPVVQSDHLVAQSVVNASDLLVTDIFVPANSTPGQEVSIGYVVKNQSTTGTTISDWVDSVYLSLDGVLDPSDVLVGRVNHSGVLDPDETYLGNLTTAMPAINPGQYRVIVVTDSRSFVPDVSRTNNRLTSAATTTVSVPALTLGTPINGTIRNGEDIYYRIDLPAGKTFRIASTFPIASQLEMYVRYQSVPTTQLADQSATGVGQTTREIVLPGSQAGPYYIQLHGREGAVSGQAFTLLVEELQFDITRVENNRGSNAGSTTVTLIGAGFTPTTTARLQGGPVDIAATNVFFKDSTTVHATFNLVGVPAGTYSLVALNDTTPTIEANAFTVTTGAAGRLVTRVSAPAITRALTETTVTVDYENAGETDIVAPLLSLTADWADMRLPEQADYVGRTVTFLGINPDGPAGILPAGFKGSITFPAISRSNGAHIGINYQLKSVQTPSRLANWESFKNAMRPADTSAEAWDAIFANFTAQVGTTAGSYQDVLAQSATYLSQLGVVTYDASRLLGFELTKANALLTGQSLSTFEDAGLPTEGAVSLTFARSYNQSISGRYEAGRLGRGWTDNWNVFANTAANGDVTVTYGNEQRLFLRNTDGSYRSVAGNFARLELVSGALTVYETNNHRLIFRPDGKLDYVRDANDNRITVGYNGAGQMTSLTHSRGQSLTFTYNGQGRIITVADSTGRTATYGYDASGEHLETVTDRYGVMAMTYSTGQGAAREHALSNIVYPDGSNMSMEYDSRGRLIQTQADPIATVPQYRHTVAYGPNGEVSITNAEGATITYSYDHLGQPRRVVDPLGRVTLMTFDQNHLPVQIIRPDGTTFRNEYDARGNLLKMIEPDGRFTSNTYSPTNQLLSTTDQRGNRTLYAYDAFDNLEKVTYADLKENLYDYDPQGNVISWTNGRGQNLQYSYDALGRIATKTYADSSTTTFNRDARGRVLSATNPSGTYLFTYNALDQIETFTDPFGRSLAFEYDSIGRRTQSEDQDGKIVNYIYDTAGRLKELRDGSNMLIVSYAYDAIGRLTRKDMNNDTAGVTGDTATEYDYDLAGQLEQITNYGAGGAINSQYTFTYDALGLRRTMTMTDADPLTTNGTTTYDYDAIGQLTNIELPGGRTIEYRYDAAGNRLMTIDSLLGTTNFVANNRNQITQAGSATMTYDDDGNVISIVDGVNTTTFNWTQENLLAGETRPGLSIANEYDPFAGRVSSTRNGLRTEYLLDPLGNVNVVGEYTTGTDTTYVFGHGLVSQSDGTNTYFYDTDGSHNIAGLTNSVGNYISRFTYLPFGETTTVSALEATPFTFGGDVGVMDEGSGEFFMRARHYNTMVGQFLSDDPIGLDGGSMNFRKFVGNSPTNFVDPSGLQPDDYWNGPENGGGHNHFGGNDPLNPGNNSSNTGGDGATGGRPNSHQQLDGRNLAGVGERGAATNAGNNVRNVENAAAGAGKAAGKGAGMGTKALAAGAGVLGALGKFFKWGDRIKMAELVRDYLKNPKYWRIHLQDPKDQPSSGPSANPNSNAPGDSSGGASSDNRTSNDPNELVGPGGFGPEGFIPAGVTLPYIIRFENKSDATLPAQTVTLTQTLDADLDLDTFQLTAFNFGQYTVEIPPGRDAFTARVDARAEFGLFVDIKATLNRTTRVLSIVYESIDPVTLDRTGDPVAGFLPPNNPAIHDGEGYVSYNVKAKSNLGTGAAIEGNFARIIFDANDPIDTNTTLNTIDIGAPTANVNDLPEISTTLTFPVTWAGIDDLNGSDVGSYDVYVSDNGGPWTIWQNRTTATSANFTGEEYHEYRFHAVGVDNVGNVEPNIPTVEAFTIATQGAYAVPDVFGADAGRTLSVPARTGVLANDPKLKTRKYTAQLVAGPTHGTLTLRPDGSFTYVPGATFTGLDSFTYQTKDSTNLLGNVATVALATQIASFAATRATASEARPSASYVVSLRKPATAVTTVDYEFQAISARLGIDFTGVPGTVTFQPGERTKTIVVPLTNDTVDEADESFRIVLRSPTNTVIGMKAITTVTIKDNDAAPKIGFSVATTSFNEGAGTVSLVVNLSAASERPISVQFTVPTGTAGGTARPGADYTFTPGTLTFAPGQTSKTITLGLIQETTLEPNETIKIRLTKPTNAVLGTSLHTLSILNDDV